MLEPSRYRVENGEPCVDVKLTSIEQLFDHRDPAPFRERDLDPDLAQYLLDAGEDLSGHPRIRVVFWVDRAPAGKEVEQAVHAHFDDLIMRIKRSRRRRRRTGQVSLVLAVFLVIPLLAVSQLISALVGGSLGTGLEEGLVIASWVVMWRPVDVLIYDWIPTRHERKVATKLRDAPIEVRVGTGPT